MVLATIIRLEMAYPGVGVLAGDSLQYLSVVTAHAVIMVFFMIMPLLFGAFGNFLLPTQLGVHDVAFPRLNSAAFWFLPAGLLMLVQLVCLDRRYQRMNCYNIREIQTILKSQYSPNSDDSANVNFLLNETALGLRYKLMGLTSIDSSMLNYYRNSIQPDTISNLSLAFKLNKLKLLTTDSAYITSNQFECGLLRNLFILNLNYLYSAGIFLPENLTIGIKNLFSRFIPANNDLPLHYSY
jgi:hypothetical protein